MWMLVFNPISEFDLCTRIKNLFRAIQIILYKVGRLFTIAKLVNIKDGLCFFLRTSSCVLVIMNQFIGHAPHTVQLINGPNRADDPIRKNTCGFIGLFWSGMNAYPRIVGVSQGPMTLDIELVDGIINQHSNHWGGHHLVGLYPLVLYSLLLNMDIECHWNVNFLNRNGYFLQLWTVYQRASAILSGNLGSHGGI